MVDKEKDENGSIDTTLSGKCNLKCALYQSPIILLSFRNWIENFMLKTLFRAVPNMASKSAFWFAICHLCAKHQHTELCVIISIIYKHILKSVHFLFNCQLLRFKLQNSRVDFSLMQWKLRLNIGIMVEVGCESEAGQIAWGRISGSPMGSKVRN